MRLRAPKARPKRALECSVTYEWVRAMTYRLYGAFIASLGVVALILAANETFAGSGLPHSGGLSAHPTSHRPFARSFRHHRGNNVGAFWPGDVFDGPSNVEPMLDVTPPPTSGDIHYTNTYDVPWDWAHRFPPAVIPSERAYVPQCTEQSVTVPSRGGKEQTVDIMRCY
jgi:hypothetical protein